METAERQHAKRIEQTLASINKNLERIAKSLEKMEPIYLTKLTAEEGIKEEPATEDEKIFKSNTPTPDYWRDCLSDTFKP